MKIKKGDTVKILSGKDKGKTGKVATIFRGDGRIIVEGVNIKKKHLRPRKQGQKGQTVEISAPLNSSNAMVVCPSCKKPSRLGIKTTDGKKMRVCKKCGTEML